MTDKNTTEGQPMTYFYGDEATRLAAAQAMYEKFCENMKRHPEWARSQFVSSMQSALGQAYTQGTQKPMADQQATDLDALTAAVIALTRHDIRPDIQELLIYGDPVSGVRPGALKAALVAAGVNHV